MAASRVHARPWRRPWLTRIPEGAPSSTSILLALALAVLALLVVPSGAMSAGTASGTSATLSQCTNGGVGSSGAPPTLQQCAGGGNTAILNGAPNANGVKNWVSGNANGSKSHWREGDFIAYRTQITAPAGSHTLVFHYDTIRSSKHAIDYLGSYDATETTDTSPTQFHANYNTPCADLVYASPSLMSAADCASPPQLKATIAVPAADLAGERTCAGAQSKSTTPSQATGSFKIFGPGGTAINAVSYPSQNVVSGSGTCTTTVSITFTIGGTGSQNVVLAWGGHIASGLDWGTVNSASTISGSPFHMSLDMLDGASTGSQDRALASTAVFFNPTLSTQLSASQVNVGGSVYDTASLSGASSTAGGTVTYSVYSDSACSTKVADAGAKNVTNGVVPNSNAVSFNSSGTYYWQAFYSGDSQNIATTSPCQSEVLTVGKASPSISTTLSTASTSIGAPVHDSATLTNATSNAGGTVTYTAYSDSACTNNAQSAGTKTVTNGTVANSNDISFSAAGTYYWQAVYSGDANNNGATSVCTSEQVVIGKNSPSISTTLSGTSVSIGAQVHDSAKLSGATAGAGGTVTYTVFSDSGCSQGARSAGQVTVTNGTVPDSSPLTLNAAGTYYWQAVYSGDGNNSGATSVCTSEQVVVGKNNPTIGTTLSATSAAIGSPVHDSATLSGQTSDAGGTVTYTVWSDSGCSQGPQNAGTKTVTGGVVPDSDPVSFSAAGTYYWQAVYSGDNNNGGATSACQSEVLSVARKSPSIATTLSTSATSIGSPVHDSATLTGATSNAGGTVTYTVYSDSGCSQGARSAGQAAVTNGSVDNSNDITFSAAGTYYWQAVYSGDGNNNGATSVCTSEQVVVGKNSPSIGTTLSTASTSIGTPVHDSATLTGATSDAGGTVTYTAFSDSGCSQDARSAGQVTVTNGSVPDSGPLTFSAAGTYYWQASYTGDSNNEPATSDCTSEVLTVAKNSPLISTTLSSTSASIGSPVHDSASLSGKTSNAGGTVTYTVYSDQACSQNARDAGTKPVTNGVVTDSNALSFTAAGTYYWQAVYSGDANNNGATSACTSEVLQVTKNTPSIATTLSASSASIGTPVHDSAGLTGATGDAGGTVTYTVYGDGACTKNPRDAGTVTVTNGSVPDSNPLTFTAAGTYYWQAVYSGDNNNEHAASACQSEVLTVTKNRPSVSTGQRLTPNDSATFTGLTSDAGGTVTFDLFAPSDATCSGSPAYTATVNVSSNGTYATSNTSFVASTAGTWRWRVTYSGDDNNEATTSACGVENFTLTNG